MPGVYLGFVDKMPMGAFVNKGLTMKTGQTHVHRYLKPLTAKIEAGDIDPSFVITHKAPLSRRAGPVQDVPRQAGRVHQGRLEAVTAVSGVIKTDNHGDAEARR